jgi:hypothetical protein
MCEYMKCVIFASSGDRKEVREEKYDCNIL